MTAEKIARPKVILDGKQAEQELELLKQKADKLKEAMLAAATVGDTQKEKKLAAEYKATTKEMTNMKREAFSVENVLKNINGASINELSQALRKATADYKKMQQTDPGFAAQKGIVDELKGKLGELGVGTSVMSRIAQSASSIPGPVGNAVNSISTMGKSLWALVANPIGATIAAIVVSLTLLYKAFTSTDSGANAMAGTLKAIGNVMDILIDRAMSYYKMLWSLVTFDWEGVKKNAKDAFGGITQQIKDATSAGWDYAHVMDSIGDREAAAQIRMAKLRAEIELLKNQSKDVNKTTKEKSDLIEQAMNKEIELNGIEKGFLKERTAAETNNLASKINNSKMSMAQKQAQLEQWLATDDKELESMMEKNAAFAEFVNKNEEGFQALQKMKAEEFDKDADFQTETRRLQKSASSEKKALRDEEAAAIEEGHKKSLEQLDAANNDRMAKITDDYIKNGWTDAKFKEEQLAAEQAYLILKRAMLKEFGMSTIDIDQQINQKRIEAQKTANEEFAKSMSDLEKEKEATDAQDQEAGDAAIAALIERTNAAIKIMKDAEEKEKEALKARQEQYLQFSVSAGKTFADLMNDNEATMADYLKATLVMALDAFHEFFMIEKAKAIISGMGKGPVGIAIAIAKVVAMEVAYQAVRAALTSKKSGSKQSGGYANFDGAENEVDGVYHKKEFIASAPAVRNPTVKPILDIINLAQQRGTIAQLNLPAVLSATGSKRNGRQSGGFAASSHPELVSGSNPIMQSAASIDTATANRLSDSIDRLTKWKPTVYTEDIKKGLKTLDDIERNRGL